MAAANPFQTRYLDILRASPYLAPVLRPGQAPVDIAYYAYNTRVGSDAVPLAAGVAQTQTIETQSDSDFVLTFMSAAIQPTAGGAMQYNANVALQVTDLSTGKPLFSTDTAIALVTGAGGFPYVLPAPRVWSPNITIAVKATNHDTIINGGLGPVGLFIAFHGTRIFYGS